MPFTPSASMRNQSQVQTGSATRPRLQSWGAVTCALTGARGAEACTSVSTGRHAECSAVFRDQDAPPPCMLARCLARRQGSGSVLLQLSHRPLPSLSPWCLCSRNPWVYVSHVPATSHAQRPGYGTATSQHLVYSDRQWTPGAASRNEDSDMKIN